MYNQLKMKSLKKQFDLITFALQHKYQLIFITLLIIHIFFRFYQLFVRANLGWDQIDSAWAAKEILVDKHFLLQGPVAKGNSGIYMGPLYYYLNAIFYFFTNLDPIASPIFVAVASIVNTLILFVITKKLFNWPIALIALFINTFSFFVIGIDRVQSAYYFIVPISYLIFYFLYKAISGEPKNLIYLAISVGLSFHIDFTSVFYPIIILFTLPFIPFNKKTFKYVLISIFVFLILLTPTLINELKSSNSVSSGMLNYLQVNYHGIHITRILQITHDAFITFEQILQFTFFRPLVYLFLPLFMIVYSLKKSNSNNKKRILKNFFQTIKLKLDFTKDKLLLFYLMILWTVIPWLILSTYSGELTSYYFGLPRDFNIAILAYLTYLLIQQKLIILKLAVIVFWGYFALSSTQSFFKYGRGDLLAIEQSVRIAIDNKQVIQFKDHDAASYVYYIYTR